MKLKFIFSWLEYLGGVYIILGGFFKNFIFLTAGRYLQTSALSEWFSSNRRLSYAHRIMGSPGGKHCKSLQRNVWRGAVSPFKTSVFGQRMPHFAVILWEAEVTNVGAVIVSFCGINAMKSIDKHSFLRKVDCEIYWMVSKYIEIGRASCRERV